MTLLYFLRHGVAEDKKEWQGDDAARPLTQEGLVRMAVEAETIAQLGLPIETILTSPLIRAAQTAEIVARRLEMMDKLVHDKRLSPGFGIDRLAPILGDHPKAAALMLVGHEPDFSETIRQIIGGGRVVVKKGALVCVELPEGKSTKGKLEWLLPPQVLAR